MEAENDLKQLLAAAAAANSKPITDDQLSQAATELAKMSRVTREGLDTISCSVTRDKQTFALVDVDGINDFLAQRNDLNAGTNKRKLTKNAPSKEASAWSVLSPMGAVDAARKAHPAFRYAIAAAGLVGLVAIVSHYGISLATAVFGSVVLVVLMVLFLVFVQAASVVHAAKFFSGPVLVLVWGFLVLAVLTALFLFTSTFFDQPLPLRTGIVQQLGTGRKSPDGSSDGSAKVRVPDVIDSLTDVHSSTTHNVPQHNLYILCVGINEYGAFNRHSAVSDARAFAAVFAKQKGKEFLRIDQQVLTDVEATQHSVLNALQKWGADAAPDDLAVAFFSGNAGAFLTNATPGRYAFLCFDSDYHEPERTGITGNQLMEACARVPCPKILIMDTATYGGICSQESRDATPSIEVQRQTPLEIIVASWSQSGGAVESSFGQSPLSRTLLDALGGAADENQTGVVTFSKLWDYVLKNDRNAALTDHGSFRELKPNTVLVRVP